jgi:hypothetical protein
VSERAAGRPTILTIAAAVLFLTGGVYLLDAPVLALLPPLLSSPVPPLATAFGILGVAAAIGVLGVRSWARTLGLAIIAVDFGRTLVALPDHLVAGAGRGAGDLLVAALVGFVIPGTVTAFTIHALGRRWPSPDAAGELPRPARSGPAPGA